MLPDASTMHHFSASSQGNGEWLWTLLWRGHKEIEPPEQQRGKGVHWRNTGWGCPGGEERKVSSQRSSSNPSYIKILNITDSSRQLIWLCSFYCTCYEGGNLVLARLDISSHQLLPPSNCLARCLQKAAAHQNGMHGKLPWSAYQPGSLGHQGLLSGLEDQAGPAKRRISFGKELIQGQVCQLCS